MKDQKTYLHFPKATVYTPWKFFGGSSGRGESTQDHYVSCPILLTFIREGKDEMFKYFETKELCSVSEENTKATISDLFWGIWEQLGYKYPANEYTRFSFQFEVSSCLQYQAFNRHPTNTIKLISVRDMNTMKETDIFPFITQLGWDHTKKYPLQSQTNQTVFYPKYRGIFKEDHNGNRIKIMCPIYTSARKLFWIQEPDERQKLFLEILRQCFPVKLADILPEVWHKEGNEIEATFLSVYTEIQSTFQRCGGNLAIKADFAAIAKESPFSAELFAIYKHDKYYTDLLGYFQFIKIGILSNILGKSTKLVQSPT